MDLTEMTGSPHRHPWEVSRCQNILKLLPRQSGLAYADVGAGDAFFSSTLAALPHARVYAVDNEYADARTEDAGIIRYNDVALLGAESIDCLILMDVLEHVEDEDAFLAAVLGKLQPNGTLVITVPAMQFLFSSHDVFLKHYRRYSRKRLLAVLHRNGMRADRCHYFYTGLFLVRCLSVPFEKLAGVADKKNEGIGAWRFSATSIVSRLLVAALNADFFLNALLNTIGLRMPGLSLVAVCRKSP